jgi:RNA polymerase sigma factor (sigma-70 family)
MILEEEKVMPIINYWAGRFARNFPRHEFADLVNQAYIGKVQKVTRIDHVSTVVRCDIIDYLRYNKRRDAHDCIISDDQFAVEPEHLENTAAEESKVLLDLLMSELKPNLRERSIILMVYYKGMTFEEIGKVFDVSKSTVWNAHEKIISRLQEILCLYRLEKVLTLIMHHQPDSIVSHDVRQSFTSRS